MTDVTASRPLSERTQLIVTTHSDVLVDALSDMPEAVLVAGRSEAGTTLERLCLDMADAGLGTINDVRLSLEALDRGAHVATPLVILNRFDPADDVHRRNRNPWAQ